MTFESCQCTNSRCLPLCPTCRRLAKLIPGIRSQLRQIASGYGLILPGEALDDLTQEVLQGLAGFNQTREEPIGIINCLCRRRLIDWMRRSAWLYRRESRMCRVDEIDVWYELSEPAFDLIMAMDRMPEGVRMVFLAHGIEERSREETAALLNISLATVRKFYAVAIRIVAQELGIEGSKKPDLCAGKSSR